MCKRFSLVIIGLCVSLIGGAIFAADGPLPRRYNPQSADRSLVTLETAESAIVYSAWSYRNQGGYDIAFSMRDADGRWSEPTFFGLADGIDQLQPALAIDAGGNLYIAWTEAPLGAIRLSTRAASSTRWTPSVVLTSVETRGVAPTLSIIGDRLVAGWREGASVVISDLGPTLQVSTRNSTRTIQDGADPLGITSGVDGTGGSSIGERTDDPGEETGTDPGDGSRGSTDRVRILRRGSSSGS